MDALEAINTPEGINTTESPEKRLLVALEAIVGVFREGRREMEDAATWTKH